jgi:hypothetical protein
MQQPLTDQLQAIREQLDAADEADRGHEIGHILVALSALTDVVEQLAAGAIERERDQARRDADEQRMRDDGLL